MIFAIEIPNIGVVIDLLGCLAAVFIFIFPGVCLWQTTLTTDPEVGYLKSKVLLLFAGFFLTIGAFLFGVVLTQVITSFLSPSIIINISLPGNYLKPHWWQLGAPTVCPLRTDGDFSQENIKSDVLIVRNNPAL